MAAGDRVGLRGDQLPLAIETQDARETRPLRTRAMQPEAGIAPFDDPDYFFEPWWPGSRAIVQIEGDALRLEVDHLADPLSTFPELAAIAYQVAGDAVLDGTLLVLDERGRPDAELLRRRLEGIGGARGHPAFVATDLIQTGARSVAGRPFRERRDRLLTLLPDGEWAVVGRGYERDGRTVAAALARMGLDGMSARRLSAPYRAGPAGDAWLRLPLTPSAPGHVRPSLTLIQRLPL